VCSSPFLQPCFQGGEESWVDVRLWTLRDNEISVKGKEHGKGEGTPRRVMSLLTEVQQEWVPILKNGSEILQVA